MVDAGRRAFFRGRARPKAEIRPPWARDEAAFIDHCTRCNDCLKACPQNILVAGDGGYPTVDFKVAECTFCGDCVSACQPKALWRAENAAPWPYTRQHRRRLPATSGRRMPGLRRLLRCPRHPLHAAPGWQSAAGNRSRKMYRLRCLRRPLPNAGRHHTPLNRQARSAPPPMTLCLSLQRNSPPGDKQ